MERLSLSETFSLVDLSEVIKREERNVGALLLTIRDLIVEEDNKVCQVMKADDLAGDVENKYY